MANYAFKGREGKLLISATSSSTGTSFGGLRNWRITVTASVIDASYQENMPWQSTLPGVQSWNLTAETAYLSTAATTNEQDTLRAALIAGTRKYYTVTTSTATGGQSFKGWGYVTNFDIGGNNNDVQLHNFTITGDGALAEA